MIDLRSDTVTRPSPDMLQAMVKAKTGDDVYGEDPTVNELEQYCASMTGKEAGLFVTSGTQGNLLALLSHCQRGDEYIAGQEAHTYQLEAGGGAVLGGIQPQPILFNDRGELELPLIEQVIKPDNIHFARTRLLCLENTQSGKVLSLDYLAEFSDFADSRKLAKHLDGARVFNAAIYQSVAVTQIAQHFDTVSICLSKGLGAPVGSVLVGSAETLASARRWRKMLGGGMRQAGVLAAAGIYALKHHLDRLAEDHHHASLLAAALSLITGLGREGTAALTAATNMVFLDLPADRFDQLRAWLAEHDIIVSTQRLVMHRDISTEDVNRVIAVCQQFPGSGDRA